MWGMLWGIKKIGKNNRLLYVAQHIEIISGVPKGIRTPVADVKGRCPWPTRRWGLLLRNADRGVRNKKEQ